MPKDPLDWKGYVKDKFFDNPIEREALELAYATAKDHYVSKPTDRTNGSIYYMTQEGLDRVMKYIRSHSSLVQVGDHIFISNINWR